MGRTLQSSLRWRSDRGMSLSELVVVVAILAILVAIAVPVYLNIQAQARNSSLQTTLQNFRTIYEYELVKGQTESDALAEALKLSTNQIIVAGSSKCIEADYAEGGNQWHIVLSAEDENAPQAGTIASGPCTAFLPKFLIIS